MINVRYNMRFKKFLEEVNFNPGQKFVLNTPLTAKGLSVKRKFPAGAECTIAQNRGADVVFRVTGTPGTWMIDVRTFRKATTITESVDRNQVWYLVKNLNAWQESNNRPEIFLARYADQLNYRFKIEYEDSIRELVFFREIWEIPHYPPLLYADKSDFYNAVETKEEHDRKFLNGLHDDDI